MVGGQLFYGHPDATGAHALHRHAFDGTSYGPATVLAPYRDPFWSGISTGSGQTYQGSPSNFSSQLGAVTGMFFRDGRLYYTRANNQGLGAALAVLLFILVLPIVVYNVRQLRASEAR